MNFLEDKNGAEDLLGFDSSFGENENKDVNTFTGVQNNISDCTLRILNPVLLDLTLTKWTSVPSYIILIISSVLILYIVLKKYRSVLNVHFSVLFYIFWQIQFLVVTTVSWVTESSRADKSLTDKKFQERCKMKVPFQTFSMILPGYAVLMMTLVRTIFVCRPLTYFDYIRRRYQVFGAGLSAVLCALISSLPSMKNGVSCAIRDKTYPLCDTSEWFRYCTYDGESCSLYFVVLVGLGSVLPVVLISCLYIYIYNLAVTAKKAHEVLMRNNQAAQNKSSCCKNDDLDGKKVTDKISRERRKVPWSIIAILGIFVASSTPWIVLQVLKDEITDVLMKQQSGSRTFDWAFALVQLSVGLSLLIYLLTTTSLRSAFVMIIKHTMKITKNQ